MQGTTENQWMECSHGVIQVLNFTSLKKFKYITLSLPQGPAE